MYIKKIQLQHFRCFENFEVAINNRLCLIKGFNGSGKTSFFEALYYACYLRSFRTSYARELVQFGRDHFFIKVCIADDLLEDAKSEIQVGFSDQKKLVKVNKRSIQSYKDLFGSYRIVAMHDSDLDIIQSGPEARRFFIDQALTLFDQDYAQLLRTYKNIVYNRNALLHTYHDKDSYMAWSQKLWDYGVLIQRKRISFFSVLEKRMLALLQEQISPTLSLHCLYKAQKNMTEVLDLNDFFKKNAQLYEQETTMKRTLFGPHLDNISFIFKEKTSRHYASRGQQKLIATLLKIALIEELLQRTGPVIVLLDDIMNDFDDAITATILTMLMRLPVQIIISSPFTSHGSLEILFNENNFQFVNINQ